MTPHFALIASMVLLGVVFMTLSFGASGTLSIIGSDSLTAIYNVPRGETW